MKRKIIGFIVFLLLITFSILSKAEIVMDDKDMDLSVDNCYNFNKQPISGSHILDLWIEQDKLESTVGVTGDYFGSSVSIDGSFAIIGAYGDDSGTGSVYIYNRSGTSWVEEQKVLFQLIQAILLLELMVMIMVRAQYIYLVEVVQVGLRSRN
jgi:hypothetical protein